jgi:hypothetical protein
VLLLGIRMPLLPEYYSSRAEEIEAAAAETNDLTLRKAYIALAAQYRDMATNASSEFRKKAAELDLLALNMVQNTKKAL